MGLHYIPLIVGFLRVGGSSILYFGCFLRSLRLSYFLLGGVTCKYGSDFITKNVVIDGPVTTMSVCPSVRVNVMVHVLFRGWFYFTFWSKQAVSIRCVYDGGHGFIVHFCPFFSGGGFVKIALSRIWTLRALNVFESYASLAIVSTICFPIQCDMCPLRIFRHAEYWLNHIWRFRWKGFSQCDELEVLFRMR